MFSKYYLFEVEDFCSLLPALLRLYGGPIVSYMLRIRLSWSTCLHFNCSGHYALRVDLGFCFVYFFTGGRGEGQWFW